MNENLKTKLTLAYDGTAFCGWQVQKDSPTVQSTLQDAIESVCGRRLPVTGCSRTDSGVHALEFVCHTDFINIPCDKLPLALNSRLPGSISVYRAEQMPQDFHARYSCLGKEYIYKIYNSPLRDPFYVNRAMFYPKAIDDKRLDDAAKAFVGKKDFCAFMAQGSKIIDTTREISHCSVERENEGNVVTFRVAADGFLYNMVRIIVGTLLLANEKKLVFDDICDIINSKKRENAGATVPACGLYLNKVFY